MLRTAVAVALLAVAAGAAAANVETLTERSQEKARAVLDRAVAANGGADAIREVERRAPAPLRRDVSRACR